MSQQLDLDASIVLNLVHTFCSVIGDAMGAVVLAVIFARPSGDAEDEGQAMGKHGAVVDAIST